MSQNSSITSPRRFGQPLTLVWLTVLAINSTRADEVQKLDEPEEYVVSVADSGVYSGAERVASASLGAIISVSHHRGPWRYSDDLKGWIHNTKLIETKSAIDAFTKKISANPDPENYHLRGISYMAVGEWARAVNDLEHAYELGDSSIMIHMNLATCYQKLDFAEKAFSEYETLISNFPEEPGAYLARGELLLDQDDAEAALKDFGAALKLTPENAELHNSIGISLRMLGDTEKSIDSFSTAIELNPRYEAAYLNRGYAHKSLKQFDAALTDYEKALEIAPKSAAAMNDLAWMLSTAEDQSVRDPERAIQLALEACRSENYREGDYVDTLATAYASAGQFDKAVETARTAIELYQDQVAKEDAKSRLILYEAKKPFIEVAATAKSGSEQ